MMMFLIGNTYIKVSNQQLNIMFVCTGCHNTHAFAAVQQ